MVHFFRRVELTADADVQGRTRIPLASCECPLPSFRSDKVQRRKDAKSRSMAANITTSICYLIWLPGTGSTGLPGSAS